MSFLFCPLIRFGKELGEKKDEKYKLMLAKINEFLRDVINANQTNSLRIEKAKVLVIMTWQLAARQN